MTRAQILDRWRSRLTDWKEVHAQVDGETIARQVITDIEAMATLEADDHLTLTAASKEGGVSTRQLSRLVQQGKLENVGRRNAPRVRRKDIPRKAALADSDNVPNLQVIREAVGSKLGQRGRSHGT